MFKDVTPAARAKTVRRARRLRRDMTLPEVLLWQALRTRPSGLKFRRQHPAGPYVLDFYCSDARLAIEIDGEIHAQPDRIAADRERDHWLGDRGVATLRVPARDILQRRDEATAGIVTACRARLPLHHPAAPDGPPPRAELGEDR